MSDHENHGVVTDGSLRFVLFKPRSYGDRECSRGAGGRMTAENRGAMTGGSLGFQRFNPRSYGDHERSRGAATGGFDNNRLPAHLSWLRHYRL